MLRSINTLPDDHNGHLRNLIDQRNTRADVHSRLSAAVSDFSDSPSVYSHSYFSPRASEISDSHIGSAYSPSVSGVCNGRYGPHTSMLDLTEDQRSSYVSQDYENADSTSDDGMTDESETTTARMSYLGPKMRVHSRAPWEEEALEEVDEENVPGSSSLSRRHAAKSIASAFSSPRPSFSSSVGQRSEDSLMTQPSTKRSFETVSSQSLSHTRSELYSLAQDSTSSNSLGRRTPVKETFLNKLSIGRLRRETSPTTNVPNTLPIPSPMSSSTTNFIPTTTSRQPSPIKTHSAGSSCDSLEFLSVRKAPTHPYANPDLIVSYPEGDQNASAPSDTRYTVPHCDSDVSVTPMESKFNALARISIPDSSVGSKFRPSPISTRNISSPVNSICSPQNLRSSLAERLPGWDERPSAAAFSLISLEEARAKRMRTSTDTASTTLSSSDSGTPFPADRADYSTSSLPFPLVNLGSRARGRSISAGANAKNALHNILGQPKSDSDPVLKGGLVTVPPFGKTLKNKKSGFLRIFNRDLDKDIQSVPPVPSIPDGINQLQPSQRLAAATIHRVPVPTLSQPEISISQNYGSSLPTDIPTNNKNSKRPPPPLSLDTTTQGSPARSTTIISHAPLGVLQSAPPDHPEFPILKLRPVSMLFSASFGDFVPSELHETTGQETPRSCTPPSSSSPLTTPTSPSRPLDRFTSVINDENHLAAEVLQEQMLSSKNSWQRHIWELERQVRDLKAELNQLKNNDEYCGKCGRGRNPPGQSGMTSTVTRTGTSSRYVVNHRTR